MQIIVTHEIFFWIFRRIMPECRSLFCLDFSHCPPCERSKNAINATCHQKTGFQSFKKNFPEFQLDDLNGNPVKSDSLKGIKVLNVWASWCITCLVEHPFLTKLSEQNIQIIGLNYKDSDLKANAWLKKHGNPYLFSMKSPG